MKCRKILCFVESPNIGIFPLHQFPLHQFLFGQLPTSSIPIWSTSHFINSHFVNSHLVNVDKVGIDKVGIDELGSWQSGNWRTGKLTKWEDWPFYVLLTTILENIHRTLVPACIHQSTAPQHLPTRRCHQRRTSSNWTCSSLTWCWITPTQTKEKFIAVDQHLKLLEEVYIGGEKTIDQYIVDVAYNLSSFV